MSQESVEIVRGVMESFIAGDPVWDRLEADIEVHDHDIMDAREYRGHDGFASWLDNWGAAWTNFSMAPEQFLDAGDHVVMVFRMKAIGRGSGIAVERQDAMVYSVRDGKIARVDYYNSKQQALDAVGLEG
jgi:ketosteroid isomerase-like protein